MAILDILKVEEGFKGTVYKDHLGFDTIGYGTLLPLTEYECELLLMHRLRNLEIEVSKSLRNINISADAWTVLYLMAYQMGVPRLLKFKNMIKALDARDYKQASVEMLDSRWAKQTPSRANRMADMMSCGNTTTG